MNNKHKEIISALHLTCAEKTAKEKYKIEIEASNDSSSSCFPPRATACVTKNRRVFMPSSQVTEALSTSVTPQEKYAFGRYIGFIDRLPDKAEWPKEYLAIFI